LRSARQVFSELGYDAATFQAIALRADLTRPAINHYFPNKRALFAEVVNRTNALVVAAGAERAQTETTLVGRLEAFLLAAVQADSEDRSAAAFLVASVLESQRHPELRQDDNNSLEGSRAFVTWAVTEAIGNGELDIDTDVNSLVEMLVAVLWGMGFYAGFVGTHQQLEGIIAQLRLLLEHRLWQLNPAE
jgi:AcrR family transcriptional regulator